MKNNIFYTLAIILLISSANISCSMKNTMHNIMTSWKGSSLNDVVSQWGYPDEEKEFKGNKLYIWHHTKSFTLYDIGLKGECDRKLLVNDSDIVISWEWKGGNCPLFESWEYSNWRKNL